MCVDLGLSGSIFPKYTRWNRHNESVQSGVGRIEPCENCNSAETQVTASPVSPGTVWG